MNINDYIIKYSDQSFREVPFNEVDNLIFSELIYIPFSGYVTNSGKSLKKIAEAVLKDGVKLKKQKFSQMLHLLAQSKRFGQILLSNYKEISNPENQEQFAAITIQFAPFKFYVAFRGTDRNIYSYKEDLNMSFQLPVPAQSQAQKYLSEVMKKHFLSHFVVGGHSKGGNLAVYSAVTSEYKKRITLVFNNDGPGFKPDFVKTERYQETLNKMITILPQSSIVGLLMNSEIENVIVYSDANFLSQHDGFTWQVEDTYFVRENDTTRRSKFIEEAMNGWGDRLSLEEKVVFIDNIYEVFTSLNINTVDDLKAHKRKVLLELFEKFRVSEGEDRQLYIDATKAMLKSFSTSFIDTFLIGKVQEDENTSIK